MTSVEMLSSIDNQSPHEVFDHYIYNGMMPLQGWLEGYDVAKEKKDANQIKRYRPLIIQGWDNLSNHVNDAISELKKRLPSPENDRVSQQLRKLRSGLDSLSPGGKFDPEDEQLYDMSTLDELTKEFDSDLAI